MHRLIALIVVILLALPGHMLAQGPDAVYGYTHVLPDGNRYALGRGTLPAASPLDIPLSGEPAWIVGAPLAEDSLWVAVLVSGEVQAFTVSADGTVSATEITPAFLPPGMPPVLEVRDGVATLLTAPAQDASALIPPAPLPDGRLAYVTETGDIVLLEDGRETARFGAAVLPDSRLLIDETGNLHFLADPTDSYGHGVLGDRLEAQTLATLEIDGNHYTLGGIAINTSSEQQVIEGLTPLWADLDGDDVRDSFVTLSNATMGAEIVMRNGATGALANGPAIGQGFRWRHQIAVAPFSPAGELELVDVLTPHIGGVVEFYRLEAERLDIVARVRGYTSHVIGTRNLDMAAAGDFDGNGQVELLLPNQSRTILGAIRRTPDGAEVAWEVPLDGTMVTNVAAVTLAGDTLAVGVGRADGTLRLWLP